MGIALIAWLLAQLALAVPDASLTPGAVRPLSKTQVCSIKWGLDARHVTTAMKKHVAKAYGIAWERRGEFVFDHKIPRQLAGADVVANLWLQPRAEARAKDVIENRLHRQVCRGELTLSSAQAQMRRWGQ